MNLYLMQNKMIQVMENMYYKFIFNAEQNDSTNGKLLL